MPSPQNFGDAPVLGPDGLKRLSLKSEQVTREHADLISKTRALETLRKVYGPSARIQKTLQQGVMETWQLWYNITQGQEPVVEVTAPSWALPLAILEAGLKKRGWKLDWLRDPKTSKLIAFRLAALTKKSPGSETEPKAVPVEEPAKPPTQVASPAGLGLDIGTGAPG